MLSRLEKMIAIIERYYGKPNSQMIEMNVVDDIQNWGSLPIPEEARRSLLNDGGLTMSVTMSQQNELGEKHIAAAKSIVWAVSTRGVPQHEAVHAYCHQNFGRVGPTWYAEGMAELGQYWDEKREGVHIHDEVLRYLKESDPKELKEITASGQKTGDSWKNYAWRWALCHLLSTNPNYSARFKPLGMALLNDRHTSFEEIYGSMSKEISFEYLFFLKHLDQGFRCDLCAWDWKSKPQRLRGVAIVQAKVLANRGWQASRVLVKAGDKISYSASGEWILKKDEAKVGPEGDETGRGKLEGILFSDYSLSEPLDLGESGTIEIPRDGHLFLRCKDDWGNVGDHAGFVTVKLKLAQ